MAAALLTSPNSVMGCPNSLSLRMTSSLDNSSSCDRTLSILCSCCCACSPDFCLFLSSCISKVRLRHQLHASLTTAFAPKKGCGKHQPHRKAASLHLSKRLLLFLLSQALQAGIFDGRMLHILLASRVERFLGLTLPLQELFYGIHAEQL